jgi:hypothetical protein
MLLRWLSLYNSRAKGRARARTRTRARRRETGAREGGREEARERMRARAEKQAARLRRWIDKYEEQLVQALQEGLKCDSFDVEINNYIALDPASWERVLRLERLYAKVVVYKSKLSSDPEPAPSEPDRPARPRQQADTVSSQALLIPSEPLPSFGKMSKAIRPLGKPTCHSCKAVPVRIRQLVTAPPQRAILPFRQRADLRSRSAFNLNPLFDQAQPSSTTQFGTRPQLMREPGNRPALPFVARLPPPGRPKDWGYGVTDDGKTEDGRLRPSLIGPEP